MGSSNRLAEGHISQIWKHHDFNGRHIQDDQFKYDIPLFFVTVRSNAGYIVVGELIVQTESAACIKEALDVLKKWNPNWSPTFFMSDYSEAEITSLETVFPNALVYICDFHREQSWERWVKDHQHGLTNCEASQLLVLLRNCASAPPAHSTGSAMDSDYLSAVECLKASQVWLQNNNAQTWLNNYWLSIPKVYKIIINKTTLF